MMADEIANDAVADPAGELTRLREEHRDLDEAIEALKVSVAVDQLQLQRLKKRKLVLRDRITHLEDQDAWQACCDYLRLDSDTVEAYEHWIVSDWLARELEALGEMVTYDFLGLTIWGRATTGQQISADYVIEKIARSQQ